MKKKFVLTLALVLMVAATIVAAPVELSGEFKAGYAITVDPFSVDPANQGEYVPAPPAAPAATVGTLSASSDFWTVSLDFADFSDGDNVTAVADIYLDKALAEQGMDMGDLGLTLHMGNGVSADVPSVFADKGDLSSGLSMTATYNAGLTFMYSDLVTVYASVDPTAGTPPMVIGATVNAVDGVSIAGGFSSDVKGISGSAMIDVAKLAGLDFALAVSVEDIYLVDTEANELNLDVATTIEGIGLWAAYQLASDVHNVGVGASYAISGVGLSASVALADLTGTLKTTIEAGANYTMGGVKYALDTAYVVDGAFTLTPSVYIAF